MDTMNNNKNMYVGGPRAREIELEQELIDISKKTAELMCDINRPTQYTEMLQKENEFGARYYNMLPHEKTLIQTAYCDRCYMFAGEESENIASFFGMCECMWRRYVARTYDHFYTNEYAKKDRFENMAIIARGMLTKVIDHREKITNELTNVRKFLNDVDDRHKKAEAEKIASYTLGMESTKRRLEERLAQAEKNKKKIKATRSR